MTGIDANGAGEWTRGPSVFISYARVDRARVTPIAEALAAAGCEVWWDTLIDGGAAFARLIEERLASADAVVVAWSQASIQSDWVRDEAGHARDSRRLVPIALDDALPPLGFRQYHVIPFAGWRGGSDEPEFPALLRGIEAARAQAPLPAAPGAMPAYQRDQSWVTTRRGLLAGGAVAAVAVAGGGFAWWRAHGVPTRSVAVLPFANLSGDAEQAYFSDGLSEDLRAALTRLPDLQVAALTSSKFLGQGRDAGQLDEKAISAKLGVAYVIEGSVRRERDMVRIAAALIDGASGFTTWAQTFDRRLDDIFAVQNEIATTVAQAFALKFAGAAAFASATDNVSAYDAVLKGRALFDLDRDEPTDRAALAQYAAAIRIDPGYALAYAERSRVLSAIASSYAKAADLRPLYAEATAAAKTAVRLAPDLAVAQLALGSSILKGEMNFARARGAFDRALKLGWGDGDVLLPCAFFGARSGRTDEALRTIRRARQLDPLNARVFRGEGAVLSEARRWSEVEAPMREALQLNPKLSLALAAIGVANLMLGRVEAARTAFAAEPNLSFRLAGLAIVENRAGNRPAAEATLARLVSEAGESALYQQAQVLAQFGRKDAALAALERARAVLDSGMALVHNDPMLDPLRGEPRFRQLIANMGLS